MARIVVELHIPVYTGDSSEYLEDIEAFLGDLEETGEIELNADPEERPDTHVFFLAGPDSDILLTAASQAAETPGTPVGAYAVLTPEGRHIPLPWSP
ncbi:hypothetical protein EDD29_1595 [Actinocorallia herbida]|uniref:Uncharacterized protein n=1 Tax=Actinocorallia herbida TaxID=58109 RepID=A0A3N1CRZ9_9ACTN|nr:hypothetical protein [Actinocorallia herbida]ROO84083.1 hypothetical protein EDD29_1595 [Actinocorallia herbida]